MHKTHLKDWLVFTKSDRNAAVILLSVLTVVVILPYFLTAKKTEIHIDKALQAELDAYLLNNPQQNSQPYYTAAPADTSVKDTIKHELFFFDPNTLSEEGFIKLGLPQKTAHTIINYRNKGGHFKNAEDIRKVYSLSKNDADRIVPYIRIEGAKDKKEYSYNKPAYEPSKQYKKININTATAEEWKVFPGIGDAISNRIVKFRSSMGGFKNIEQVGKTYGLSDSVFQAIKPYLYLGDSTNASAKK
jgi:competence protein ComEA